MLAKVHITPSDRPAHASRAGAFVYIEVLVSMLLIGLAMGGIASSYIRASRSLRSSLQVAAASQMLQQRIEMMREQPWACISNADSLQALMSQPTASEKELSDSRFTEIMTVILPEQTEQGSGESDRWFEIRRRDGRIAVERADDFQKHPTLLLEATLKWDGITGPCERTVRAVVCQSGLTRSGITGAAFGRVDSRTSATR